GGGGRFHPGWGETGVANPGEGKPAGKRNYHTLDNRGRTNERRLAEFLTKNGQQLLPMVDLIVQSRMAIDDLVDTVGRAAIEAVLWLSAEQAAGPPQQGRMRP